MDYHACVWPKGLHNGGEALAQKFDSLNEPGLSNLCTNLEMDEEEFGERPPLITFSHFLPVQVHLHDIACSWSTVSSDLSHIVTLPSMMARYPQPFGLATVFCSSTIQPNAFWISVLLVKASRVPSIAYSKRCCM